MNKLFMIVFCCLFANLASFNVTAQDRNCITPDNSQKKLYLNGENFTLIDNALRCFKLSSIANDRDSIVRIWTLEDDYPKIPVTWRVKMFEFGKEDNKPAATLNILEWNFNKTDSSLPIKCIKQVRMIPNGGWSAFNKDIKSLHLSTLYEKPWINRGEVTVDYGMLIVQFLSGLTTYTVDYTGLEGTSPQQNPWQTQQLKKLNDLSGYIEKYFSVKLYDKLERQVVIEAPLLQ